MDLLALIFFVTLVLTGAAWWGVSRYFSSRDAAQVHNRLVGSATTAPSAGPKEAHLFASDAVQRRFGEVVRGLLEKRVAFIQQFAKAMTDFLTILYG